MNRDQLLAEWTELNAKKTALDIRIQGYLNTCCKEGEEYRVKGEAEAQAWGKERAALVGQMERLTHAIADESHAAETKSVVSLLVASLPAALAEQARKSAAASHPEGSSRRG